jgi:hypothetical protein
MPIRSFVVAAVLLCATAARADLPCVADLKKFCADTPAGGGRIQACLKSHEKDLSADCKKQLADIRRRAGTVMAVCNFDVARFCGDVQPGGGRIVKCLQDHRDDLSPECKDRIEKR